MLSLNFFKCNFLLNSQTNKNFTIILDEYTEIIMIADKGKTEFDFEPPFVFKEENSFSKSSNTSRMIKKERSAIPPLLTSYTVPFHFVESGRRNQLLICEGHKYILNNKYGEKSCK